VLFVWKQQRPRRKRSSEEKEKDVEEFQSEGQTSEDDEETLQEQEKHERRVDHKQEIEMLEKESEYYACVLGFLDVGYILTMGHRKSVAL